MDTLSIYTYIYIIIYIYIYVIETRHPILRQYPSNSCSTERLLPRWVVEASFGLGCVLLPLPVGPMLWNHGNGASCVLLHTFGQVRRVATSRCWVVSTHLQSPKYDIIFVRPVLSGHTKKLNNRSKLKIFLKHQKHLGLTVHPKLLWQMG